MSQNLFVYGTLIFPQVMHAVCGIAPPSKAARLPGYLRFTVHNQCYPAIKPMPKAVVDGVLYPNVSLSLIRQLDRYEGREYRRLRLRVTHGRDRQALAWVYVPRQLPELGSAVRDWCAAEFEARHLQTWCRQLMRRPQHPQTK